MARRLFLLSVLFVSSASATSAEEAGITGNCTASPSDLLNSVLAGPNTLASLESLLAQAGQPATVLRVSVLVSCQSSTSTCLPRLLREAEFLVISQVYSMNGTTAVLDDVAVWAVAQSVWWIAVPEPI